MSINEADLFHERHKPEVGQLAANPIGSMNFNVLRLIIDDLKVLELEKGAEIGVYTGETSAYLLHHFPKLRLMCVDPYVSYTEHEAGRTAENLQDAQKLAHVRLLPFGERVRFCSIQAAQQVPDESLDFVYIDALHTYEAVLEDLHAWYPKVRPKGLISGHDLSWPGVRSAVEKFLSEKGTYGFHTPAVSDIWFFLKSP